MDNEILLNLDHDNIMTYITCPECNGYGAKEMNIPGNEGVPEQDVEIECQLCKGEGKVKWNDPELENWGY